MPEETVTFRARMIGWRDAARQFYTTATAATALQRSTMATNRAAAEYTRQTFFQKQALFTLRRYLYNATLATTALGAAAVVTGFKFNASVQRTTIALDYLSKGQFSATEQVKEFLRIARETAFLPKQVIDIGQSFIAFGFTAEETNRVLRATGNAIAALNLPQATIDRILFALGQIRVKGKLYGEELRQLANANIPAYQYLEDALGKNVTQLNRIADAGIPASVAIEAIVRGLEAQYGGASERIRETVTGQFEILKGDLQAIMGAAMLPLFNRLAGRLQSVTAITGQMFDQILEGNATLYSMAQIFDDATGNAYHLVTIIRTLDDLLSELWGSTKLAWQVLKPFAEVLVLAAYGAALLLTAILDFINMGGKPLVYIIQLLILWMLIERFTMKLLIVMASRELLMTKLRVFWTKRLNAAYRLLWISQMLLNAAMWASPYVLIAAAVIAFAFAIYILWQRFEGLRNVLALVVFRLSPIAGAFLLIYNNINLVLGAIDWLKSKVQGIDDWMPNWLETGFKLAIPGLQQGGVVTRSGVFRVGEAGPETVLLPAGAAVQPQTMDWRGLQAAGGGINVTIHPAPVLLDGREVTEVVFRHRADRMARR
jgi:tape measure domain-containing protein